MGDSTTDGYSSASDERIYSSSRYDIQDDNSSNSRSIKVQSKLPRQDVSLSNFSSDFNDVHQSTLDLAPRINKITRQETLNDTRIDNPTLPYPTFIDPVSDGYYDGYQISTSTNLPISESFISSSGNFETGDQEGRSLSTETRGVGNYMVQGSNDDGPRLADGCDGSGFDGHGIENTGEFIDGVKQISLNNLEGAHNVYSKKNSKRKLYSLAEIPDLPSLNKKRKEEKEDDVDIKNLPINVLNRLSSTLLSDLKELNLIFKSNSSDYQIAKYNRRGAACNVTLIISGLSQYDDKLPETINKKLQEILNDYGIGAKDVVIFQNPSFDTKYHQTYLNSLAFNYNAFTTQQATTLCDILSFITDQIDTQYKDLLKQSRSKPAQYENNSDFLPFIV